MKNNNDFNNFYQEMNTLHPNLQFALERSNNNKLLFFDTEVKYLSNRLQTSVYRKPITPNSLCNTQVFVQKLGISD